MADVRLVLEVMAIECLIERTERPSTTLAHLDGMIKLTVANQALESDERQAIANALRGLKNESIRRAVKRLAATLDPGAYTADPSRLIQEAFDLRNALVHGRSRPDLERVRIVGAEIERMVGDLIAGPIVTAEVRRVRASL